jgi:type IV pilus assembly protein PilA
MTLLELIVVIVILGILAAIAIPTFLKVIQNSKDGAATETANSLSHEATALAAFTGNGAASLDANGNSYVYNAARADLTSYNFHNAVTGATNDTDYTASGTAKGTITEVTSTTWNISVGDPGESCLTASTAVDVVGTASAGACSDYVAPGSGSTTTSSSTTTTTTPVALTRGTLTSDGFAAVCNVTYQVALGSDDGVGAGIEAARGFGSAMAGQDSDLEFYSAQFYCNTNAGTSSAAAVYRTSTDSPPIGRHGHRLRRWPRSGL